jgi:hypothetical protein
MDTKERETKTLFTTDYTDGTDTKAMATIGTEGSIVHKNPIRLTGSRGNGGMEQILGSLCLLLLHGLAPHVFCAFCGHFGIRAIREIRG